MADAVTLPRRADVRRGSPSFRCGARAFCRAPRSVAENAHVQDGDGWFIVIPTTETKTQHDQPELLKCPSCSRPYLATYLNQPFTPTIAPAGMHCALWISQKGGASYLIRPVWEVTTRLTERRLGVTQRRRMMSARCRRQQAAWSESRCAPARSDRRRRGTCLRTAACAPPPGTTVGPEGIEASRAYTPDCKKRRVNIDRR